MKKVLVILVVLISLLLIYLGLKDDKCYFLALGDGLAYGVTPYGERDISYNDILKNHLGDKLEVYVNDLVASNKRIVDIINEIDNNVRVDSVEKDFLNVLVNADIITLSIGSNDFLTNVDIDYNFSLDDLYQRFDEAVDDFSSLFTLLREYCKEDIYFIGFYDFTDGRDLGEFFNYVNVKMEKICFEYNIKYVDIYDLISYSSYLEDGYMYPNKLGYEVIGNEIINMLN